MRSHHAGVRKVRNAPECPAAQCCPPPALSLRAVCSCAVVRVGAGTHLQEQCRWPECKSVAQHDPKGRHHLCELHEHERRYGPYPLLPPSPAPSPSPPPGLFGRPAGCSDQLTLVERAAIVTLHGVGWTGRDIAQELRCSENTVSLWLKRWDETRSLEDAERSGRPRCTSDDTDQDIGILSDKKPSATPKDIQRELRLPVSPHTISRRLDEIGLWGCVQETEHELTEFDIQRRLAFAHQYENWTEAQWKRVLFSDECNFYLGHHGRTYVRRPVAMSHDPKYMRQEKQLHGKVSLWGCICSEGLGHAELYAGSLDSTRHRDILRHSLIPSFKQFHPDGPWFFQQDNARFHTTPDTITFLHNKGVTIIEWPPWSPDLNPIENLWNVLKERVYSRFPQTMEEMEQFIREEHAAIDLTFISRLCSSMPRRLQLLLDNQGHKIKY
jgi:transposase